MSINSLSNAYYKSLISKLSTNNESSTNGTSETKSTSDSQSSTNKLSADNIKDLLELSKNGTNLVDYLNYNNSGKYSSSTNIFNSITDFSDSTESSDILDLLGDNIDSDQTIALSDYYNSSDLISNMLGTSDYDSSSNSITGVFEKLAEQNETYNNQLIQKAIDRMKADQSKSTNSTKSNTNID